MDENKKSLRLTVAHGKCSQCGFERILYFSCAFSYGERIMSTKDGKSCAYANLIAENIIPELQGICTEILKKENINLPKDIASQIYYITCDDIDGQKVDGTPLFKCPNCPDGKIKEDKEFGEQLMDIQMPYITHKAWDMLDYDQKMQKVKSAILHLNLYRKNL